MPHIRLPKSAVRNDVNQKGAMNLRWDPMTVKRGGQRKVRRSAC
jgi:hypothetical protein